MSKHLYLDLITNSYNDSNNPQELVASFGDWKIYHVDGTWIRDNKETAFIGGDNPAADRIKMPGKTIWIEKLFNKEDQLAFLIHELVEYFQITHNKKDYDDAHNDANIWEKKYRDGLDAVSVFDKVMETHPFIKTAIGLWEAFNKTKLTESSVTSNKSPILWAYETLKATGVELGGGNCGMVAFAILKWLETKKINAIITYATNAANEDELFEEPDIYHVLINHNKKYYDEVGIVDVNYITKLVSDQYGVETNILNYNFKGDESVHEKIIRRDTNWSVGWQQFFNELKNKDNITENDSLDFGEVPPDVDYSTATVVAPTSPNDKRKELLWKIKTGEVLSDNFPAIFKDLSTFIKKEGDKYILSNTNAPNTKLGRLYPKLYRFITTGILGDLADAPNSPFVRRIVRLAANEVERHLHSDHPSRQFAALDKRGELDDIINNYMKLNYFDVFVIPSIKTAIKNEVMARRKNNENKLFKEKIIKLLY